MKKTYLLVLLCSLLTAQTAWADNEVVFSETFAGCDGIGGADGEFDGTKVKAGNLVTDVEGWTFENGSGVYQCLKFGTSSKNGVSTTPHISLATGSTATLTFKAAGWNETKNATNKLVITADGCQITGDIDITLEKAAWKDYTVTLSDITGPVSITFTGQKRGFLDDVVVTGEKGGDITITVPEPTLTESFTFWPNTIETTRRIVTISPAENTSVRYTTDGSDPSLTDGIEVKTATSLFIKATTTVKAIGIQSLYTSEIVSKTYSLGVPVNSLADFSALADDTEAQLFLSAEQNARIIAVNGKQFTVKDDTGTLLFDFDQVDYDPTPAVQQHMAGWMIGKKQTADGQAVFKATALTTPQYMAFAARVTEPEVTGIKTITTKKETATDTYHNLSGQQVKKPTKGLYITSGKKLIIH